MSTCNTFNTDVEAEDALQIFEHANGVVSGYVTVSNFNASAGPVSISVMDDGTGVIAEDILPDNSYTVYQASISDLYVFSSDGSQVIGQVCVNAFQTIRP